MQPLLDHRSKRKPGNREHREDRCDEAQPAGQDPGDDADEQSDRSTGSPDEKAPITTSTAIPRSRTRWLWRRMRSPTAIARKVMRSTTVIGSPSVAPPRLLVMASVYP
jgi:hypothetical protein